MNKYVVLLRGVNVGGSHCVPKAEFQAALEDMGFTDVQIYLNSGNAVITSDYPPAEGDVRANLEACFGFTIPTLVLPASQIQKIAAAIPTSWTNDPPRKDKSGQKSDVLFLFDDINTPEILRKIGHKSGIETMRYLEGAIITNISRKNQAKGSLKKLTGNKLYGSMTIRNINTVRKLAELSR